MSEGHSLRLELAVEAGRVSLECGPGHEEALGRLAVGFSTARRMSSRVILVALDDLLASLEVLAGWPPQSHGSVVWQPELLRLVQSNYDDSRAIDEVLEASSEVDPDMDLDDLLGPSWLGHLTPFQRRDLTKLLSLNHSANFSVPGAGKTRVALGLISIALRRGDVGGALVICPKSAYEAWQTENMEVFGDRPLRMRVLDVAPSPPCDILIVNYERLPDLVPYLIGWLRAHRAMVVLDEAHRMKRGPGGAWGAACLALAPHAVRRLSLTGTPAPNGPRDLESVMSFVWPGQGRQRVQAAVAGGDLRAASRALKPLYVRTTKSELGLPPIERKIRRLVMPPLHREIYRGLVGEVSAQVAGRSDDLSLLGRVTMYLLMAATSPALLALGASRYEPLAYRVPPLTPPEGSRLAELMRDLPSYEMSPKFAEVAAIVAANAAVGRKTLVWSTFVRNLTTMEQLLRAHRPAMVHGGTPDRDSEIRRFRDDPDCHVLLSNPATLGEGISLHRDCHDAVYVDRDFVAGRYMQSIDRIHRLGLKPGTATTVTVLVTDETIDEVVEGRLEAKLTFMGSVLDDPAVLELADFDDEPSEGAGVGALDLPRLLEHLGVRAAA